MLDFRMESFLMVCKYMNYTKAGEALHITQPAVSQHIHIIEEHYGVKLFHYEGKSLKLTEEGNILRQLTLTAKHDELHLEEKLLEAKDGSRKLVFGTTLTIGEFVLPKKLARIIQQKKRQSVQMVVANTQELLEKLNNGAIDFAIVEGYFEKRNYEFRTFSKEDYVCVCGKDYHINENVSTVADLIGETVIAREEGSGTREILERYLQEQNITLTDFKKVIEINNMHAIKTLVEENCGITFLYKVVVKTELQQGILKEIKLKDFPLVHEFNFIWQKGSLFGDEYQEHYDSFKDKR